MSELEVRALVERYPFLIPRNVFTGEIPEDYDYTYIMYLELPKGWHKLFFQLCEDIRQPLIDTNYLDKFRFTQVKEKYNTMRCYHTGAPEEVCRIIEKYEQMAYYVCTNCGKPATCETTGYFASFCDDCRKDLVGHQPVEFIEFRDYFKLTRFTKGVETELEISFKAEWIRYINSMEVDSNEGPGQD